MSDSNPVLELAEPEPVAIGESWTKLAKGSATALLTRGTGVAISLVTAAVTARALGPEGKGILAFLSTTSALAARAGLMGLDGSFAHFHLVQRRSLEACLGAATWITILAGVVAGLVCELLVMISPAMRASAPPALSVPYFAAMPAYFVLFVSTFVLFAVGRERFFAILDVGYRAAMLVGLVIALLVLNGTVSTAVWVQIAVGLSFAMMAAIAAGRMTGWRFRFDAKLVMEMLGHGTRFYAYGLFRYALCYGGVLVAAILLSPQDAGLFAVSLLLGEGMILFAGAINLAFYPAVATTTNRRAYTISIGKRIALVSVCIGGVLAVTARPVIETVYGPAFLPSVRPFLYMLPGLILLSTEQVVSSYFAARGMPWQVVLVLLAGCAVGLLLAGPLARQAGLGGLAVAIGIAHIFVSLAVLFQFARDTDESRTSK
jgi:O-antigen/teichoic acid export membrane protein